MIGMEFNPEIHVFSKYFLQHFVGQDFHQSVQTPKLLLRGDGLLAWASANQK